MSNLFLETTEQLYKSKLFLLITSVFNTLISLFSIYAFSLAGFYYWSVLCALVFIFNVTFTWISIKQWNMTRQVTIESP